MAVFIDPRTGDRYEHVPDSDVERARSEFGLLPEAEWQSRPHPASSTAGNVYKDQAGGLWEYDTPEEAERQGLKPASAEDIQAHNHALDVEGQSEGTGLQSVVEGIGRPLEAIRNFGAEKLGLPTGQDPYENAILARQGEQAYSPSSPEARLRAEAHPLLAGVGTGIAAAPFALPVAAGAGALGAAAGTALDAGATATGIATAGGGIAGESAVQAVVQAYDDEWLTGRPVTLQNVAAYTLMFATGDLLFRGAVKLGKYAIFGAEPAATSLGGRNLVSEAQGAARELAPELAPAGGGGSVGAASAESLGEPFDNALSHMTDKEAYQLTRDASDHLHFAAQSSSEAFTRVNEGLSESLGSHLKYSDFATNAQSWEAPLLERQAKWLDGMSEQGDAVARELGAFNEGAKNEIDYGNLGKKAIKTIDSFNQRLATETDPARRNWLVDTYKKELDSLTMTIDGSFGVDQALRGDLKKAITPLREGLRKGLENPKYWGENAELQRATNGPWHTFLEHWPAVQRDVLESTGHTQFDTMGAGRVTRESTVERMMGVFSKNPRDSQEFGKHLAGAFDGLQGLIEARQAHGIAGTEGLEALAGDVRNLMEDWNLASTVTTAQRRMEIAKNNPRNWKALAGEMAEALPLGIGRAVGAARKVGEVALSDLRLPKDSAVGAVWERAYQRYAKNPVFQDPSIKRNYSDWVIDALNQRGGAVPPPVPPAASAGMPVPQAAGVSAVGPGMRQAGPLATKIAAAGGASAAGVAGLFGAQQDASAAEAPPPPAQAPEHAYRDALREIDKAGDQQIAALASEALRKRPSKGRGKGPLELFAGSRSLQDAVEASRDQLVEVAGDPAALVKQLGGSVGDLWKTHPGVYSAVVQKASQIAAYLQQNVPQPTATTLLNPRGGPISFDRAWDYASRYIGAAQPRLAMREVVRGSAPPEMIDAVRQNWPELWEPFRAHMLGQVQRMETAGRHIPSERLRRLDSMLGMDGQLDPSASLAVASHFLAAQDADAQKRQQAGQKSGGGPASSAAAASMQTRLGAINSERLGK